MEVVSKVRIDRLDLTAVGPFTEFSLDLHEGDQGLHLLYGCNEAGKTTTLRAIRYLLFGFPLQVQDDFLHPYKRLRVGGALRHSCGRVLEVIRRKGNVQTLRAADDQTVVDEAQLQAILGPVDEAFFKAMFGLDHLSLVQGGEQIASGEGDLGELLFSAGSGVLDLHSVQERLDQEAASLFLPQGKRPMLNEALAELATIREEVDQARVPSAVAQQHTQTQAQKARLEDQLAQAQSQHHWLRRVTAALPLIATRNTWLQKQQETADAPLLPRDRPAERSGVLARLSSARAEAEKTEARLGELSEQLAAIEVSEDILTHAEVIDSLGPLLGSYSKSLLDRRGLVAQQEQLLFSVQTILKNLGPGALLEDLERLRVSAAQKVRLRRLGQQYASLVQQHEQTTQGLNELQEQWDSATARLKSLPKVAPTATLRRAIGRTQQEGDLQGQVQAIRRRLQRDWQQLQVDFQTLPLLPAQVATQRGSDREELPGEFFWQFERLAVPADETVAQFEAEFEQLEDDLRDLKRQRDQCQTHQLQLARDLQQIHLRQDVPTEETLQQARQLRDDGWQLVRGCWEGRSVSQEQIEAFLKSVGWGELLAEAFEQAVHDADEVADRLRREADQVARKAQLLADQRAAETRLEQVSNQLQEMQRRQEDCRSRWRALWKPLEMIPLSPREMSAWLRRHAQLLQQIRSLREYQTTHAELAEKVAARETELAEALAQIGHPTECNISLSEVLEQAVEVAAQLEDQRLERRTAESELARLEPLLPNVRRQADQARQQLEQWRKLWAEEVAGLDLPPETSPAEAESVLENLQELFNDHDQAAQIRQRIDQIDRETGELTDYVANLCRDLAPELVPQPTEQAAGELHARLRRAREMAQRRESLSAQKQQEEVRRRETLQVIDELEGRLAAMCQEAGCASVEGLLAAEARSDALRSCQEELKHVERELAIFAGGLELDVFIEQAQQENPDTMAAELERLSTEIERWQQQREKLDQTIGAQRLQMDGRSTAAEGEEKAQAVLARIRDLAEDYARARLASVLLRQTIERYRDRNQAPVLQRAGDLFATLTCGSFEGLRIEQDAGGRQMLIGVRPGGKESVGVQGMSDGTCDQLYLALRLASLEIHLQQHEPIPLIVDDILIHFDDRRACAALEVLADFSKQTQVLFFTHNQHLVDLAETELPSHLVFKHQLTARNPAAAAGRLF